LPGPLPVKQGTVPLVESWDLTAVATPGGNRSPVVLYSDNEARVVLIGLEPGQELGEHEVKENAFLVVVDGVVQVAAGDQTIDAGAGTLVRFDPEERHAVSSRDGARLLLLLAPWPGKGHYRED
jgi:quercetin dioxygenase-like cupin family protein